MTAEPQVRIKAIQMQQRNGQEGKLDRAVASPSSLGEVFLQGRFDGKEELSWPSSRAVRFTSQTKGPSSGFCQFSFPATMRANTFNSEIARMAIFASTLRLCSALPA
jgi:hypothetical protein